MKLLLDENLSLRLVESLADLYPGSNHVHNLNLGGADDSEVWDYAKLHGFAIVSKDSDFAERSVLEKHHLRLSGYGLGTVLRRMLRDCFVLLMRQFGYFSKRMRRLVCC